MKKAFYTLSIIFVLLFAILNTTVFKTVKVSGDSMLGSLHDKDLLILNKLSKINQYDIVVFKDITLGEDSNKLLIKRVIGTEGDTVSYKSGVLYINGKPTADKYANKNYDKMKFGQITNDFDFKDITSLQEIPKDKYLVLGDNRHDSVDSRDFGLVDKKDVIGVITYNITETKKYK